MSYGLVGPMARAAGIPYDVRKAFPYLGYETYDFAVPTQGRRRLRALSGPRRRDAESTKIAQQALARITPRGVFDIQDYRIVPPPKDKVYTEMEGLIQHFLIYSQGFTVPAGDAYVPIEGPRGEHGFSIVSDGTNRPYRVKLRAPSFYACQGLPKTDRRRHDRRRHRGHRLDRRRHGRRGSMSFHPLMAYDERFHKSERKLVDEGPAFIFTPERRATLDRMLKDYPPDQKRSAVLGALYLLQEQQGYLTANGMRHVAGDPGDDAGGGRDVATYYVMFYREPVGKYVLQVCRTLSCALMGAERVTEALSRSSGSKSARPIRPGCSR